MNETLEKILTLLPYAREAIDLIEILLLTHLGRKVSKVSKTVTSPNTETGATVLTNPINIKKNLSEEFERGLALYFSGKDEILMTESEKMAYNLVKKYLEEVKHGSISENSF